MAVRTIDGHVGGVRASTTIDVERRAVTVGLENGDQIEVLSGVSAGERVVVEGPQSLKDGDKVKVLMMSNSLVTVRDLHKVFHRGGERIDVLQGVNLEIPRAISSR